ncbi:MAG: YciI family protein [Burkholderiales bacterium]|nr:YciI family protein [Burkholderiales bacterium]
MFVVLLKFSTNKANASQFMAAHNAWLKDGFDKGTFLLAGTIQPKLGGAILAHNATLEKIQDILKEDPFVSEGVVTAEIIEITPSKASEQLNFLLPKES